MTQDEVTTQILELTKGQSGWTVLPADDPMTAEQGYVVFRDDEEIMLGWPVFDKPLDPLVNVVPSAKELLEFAKQFPDASSCDDPKRLLVGLVHYQPDKGKALVCQCRLTALKGTEDQYKGPYLAIRDRLLAEAQAASEQRLKEAAALAGAIEARAT